MAAPNAQRIRFIGAWGVELCCADASEAHYGVTGREGGYVRVECHGEGTKTTWTQPFFVSEAPP